MNWLPENRRTKLTLSRATCQFVNKFMRFLVTLVREYIMAIEWE